jgi:hypothetical protein
MLKRACLAVGLALLTSTCTSSTSPSPVRYGSGIGTLSSAPPGSTLPTPSPRPAPVPTPGPAAASLAASSSSLTFYSSTPSTYYYELRLTLSETSGVSAATIVSVFSIQSSGNSWIVDDGCFDDPQSDRVPRGGTWNINQVNPYCAFLSSNNSLSGAEITLAVNYKDDAGQVGSTTFTTTVDAGVK